MARVVARERGGLGLLDVDLLGVLEEEHAAESGEARVTRARGRRAEMEMRKIDTTE